MCHTACNDHDLLQSVFSIYNSMVSRPTLWVFHFSHPLITLSHCILSNIIYPLPNLTLHTQWLSSGFWSGLYCGDISLIYPFQCLSSGKPHFSHSQLYILSTIWQKFAHNEWNLWWNWRSLLYILTGSFFQVVVEMSLNRLNTTSSHCSQLKKVGKC